MWAALVCAGLAVQVTTVAVGWQVYDLTRDPFDLGLVGLSQFAPALCLVLVTGTVADRFPRRTILLACLAVETVALTGLLALTLAGAGAVGAIFALMALLGTARAFWNPARQAIVPNLVPPADLPAAITLNTVAFHATTVGGPVLGGLAYGLAPWLAYGLAMALLAGAAVALAGLVPPVQARVEAGPRWQVLSAGFRYIVTQKVVLGAVTLDLCAVLLGGAVALLPVYARDILQVGPAGLGLLRAGAGIGAVAMAAVLIVRPIRDHAGAALFVSVALYAAATVVFAVSTVLWLSVAMLILLGAADMVSVFVRSTLVQLWTPDALRGRVNAVNQVFIGASNELGGFRAGSMAALVGPVAAVAAGGIAALAVTAAWARMFPELRRIRRLVPEE